MPSDEHQSANEDPRLEKARAKWRRIEEFWSWAGRPEQGAALVQCLYGRTIHEAVQTTHAAATQGGNRLVKGSTTMQNRIAWALVGTVIGCDFRSGPIMDSAPGPLSPAPLRAWLSELSTHRRERLAEMWVTYLRKGVGRPDPWPSLRGKSVGEGELVTAVDPVAEPPPSAAWPSLEAAYGQPLAGAQPEPTPEGGTATRGFRLRVAGSALAALAIAILAWLGLRPQTDARPSQPGGAKDVSAATSAPAAPAEGGSSEAPAAVSLRAERGGQAFAVASGDTLRSGDRFAFTVATREPLFVHLVAIDDRGVASLVYPPAGSRLLPVAEPRRVPMVEEGSFELDDDVGTERLLLLMATGPLSRAEAALAKQLGGLTGSKDWPEDWPKPGRPNPSARQVARAGSRGTARVYSRGVTLRAHGPKSAKASATPRLVRAEFVTLDHR